MADINLKQNLNRKISAPPAPLPVIRVSIIHLLRATDVLGESTSYPGWGKPWYEVVGKTVDKRERQ